MEIKNSYIKICFSVDGHVYWTRNYVYQDKLNTTRIEGGNVKNLTVKQKKELKLLAFEAHLKFLKKLYGE